MQDNKVINAAIQFLNYSQKPLNEELNQREEYEADRMSSKGYGRQHYTDNFIAHHAAPDTFSKFQYDKDTSRKVIRIPITLNTEHAPINEHVKSFLDDKGYHIKDIDSYRKGLAHKQITTGDPDRGIPYRTKMQPYKIGALLKEHGAAPHIVRGFTNDPLRASGSSNDFDLVVSHHPHDVYGMSTGRGWTSCADMRNNRNGPAAKKMEDEIGNHTHVAYLVKRGGNYDTDAIARLKFTHHTALNELADNRTGDTTPAQYRPKHQTLISEGTVYGDAPTDFRKTAEHEMSKLFPAKNDIYVKNTNVYNDNGKMLHVPEGTKPTSTQLDAAWKEVPKGAKHNLYQYVGLEGKFKAKGLRDVQTAMKEIHKPPTGNFMDDINRISSATYGLDSDQKYNGFDRNQVVPREAHANAVGAIMKQFDVHNKEHTDAVKYGFGVYTHSGNPMRSHVFDAIKHQTPLVRTPHDFDTGNKIHKLLGNRDSEGLQFADDHQLGDDPVRTLAHAGVLHDGEDYQKAYFSTHNRPNKKFNENWYEMAHRLADENAPNSHFALSKATEGMRNLSSTNLAYVYSRMNPNAKHHYSSQLGHNPDELMSQHGDHIYYMNSIVK